MDTDKYEKMLEWRGIKPTAIRILVLKALADSENKTMSMPEKLIFAEKEQTEIDFIPENSSCIKAHSSTCTTFFFLCNRVKEPPCNCRFNLAKT